MVFEAPKVLLKMWFFMLPDQNFGVEGRQLHTGSPRAAVFPHGMFLAGSPEWNFEIDSNQTLNPWQHQY